MKSALQPGCWSLRRASICWSPAAIPVSWPVKPTQLALWSFAVATAHGAGLMLLPIYLGICAAGEQDAGHQAAAALMRGNLGTAIAVSIVHATAMIVSGGIVAFAVHEWLGLRFISKSWFNLDVVWAQSLIFVGAIGLTSAAASGASLAIN